VIWNSGCEEAVANAETEVVYEGGKPLPIHYDIGLATGLAIENDIHEMGFHKHL